MKIQLELLFDHFEVFWSKDSYYIRQYMDMD